LILGIGIGVISGTVISFFKPDSDIGMAQIGDSNPSGASSADGSAPGALPPTLSGNRSQLLSPPVQLGQEMTGLLTNLQNLAAGYSDLTPGVFLYDLSTTDYLSLNGERIFSAASTIKVPILVAFFQDVEAGLLNLNETWTMNDYDVATGSGDMQYEPIGSQYSALEIATKMIVISDNTATNILVRQLGGANALNERFQSWGMTSTVIRNPLPDLEGTNTTSPKDMAMLMNRISQGELMSIQYRDQMLRIMERTRTRTLLPQGIGPEARIAHKTGDIGTMVGDVGLIDMPSGKRYAITTLVQRPHNDPRAQELIRQISRTSYESLEAPHGTQSDPSFQLPTNDTNSTEPSGDMAAPQIENPAFFNGEQ
jgi:beta-lactamase class A